MTYHATETAMIELAKARNLPHTGHDGLTHLTTALDEEHGTPCSHFARLEATRAMYDNAQLHFLDVEETLMSPENAREMIRASTGAFLGHKSPGSDHYRSSRRYIYLLLQQR